MKSFLLPFAFLLFPVGSAQADLKADLARQEESRSKAEMLQKLTAIQVSTWDSEIAFVNPEITDGQIYIRRVKTSEVCTLALAPSASGSEKSIATVICGNKLYSVGETGKVRETVKVANEKAAPSL